MRKKLFLWGLKTLKEYISLKDLNGDTWKKCFENLKKCIKFLINMNL